MFHLTPETIALIDEHRAPRLSRSQLVELALIAFANQPILSGPPDDDDRWPDALDYNGARYTSTGKVGTRNGLPVAEYERDGERVWLDKADTVYPE
jgi:hypothetical protein